MMLRNCLYLGLLIVLTAAGCSQNQHAQDAGTAPADLLPYKTLPSSAGLLYTFFNHRAEMQTVEDPQEVPQGARVAVKVTDPRHPLTGDQILVADLRSRPFKVQLSSNNSWLDQMMPKTSQLKDAPRAESAAKGAAHPAPPKANPSKLLAKHPKQAKQRSKVAKQQKPGAKQAPVQLRPPTLTNLPSVSELANQPKIILFSTSWCPSCRAARQYLKQRGVPFRELDVEQNQEALELYQSIQARYHLRPGVIPVIMINGHPYQGFSKAQIEAALATSGS